MVNWVCRPRHARPKALLPEPNFLGSGTQKNQFPQLPDPVISPPLIFRLYLQSYNIVWKGLALPGPFLPDPNRPFFECQTLIMFRGRLPDPTWLGGCIHRVRQFIHDWSGVKNVVLIINEFPLLLRLQPSSTVVAGCSLVSTNSVVNVET